MLKFILLLLLTTAGYPATISKLSEALRLSLIERREQIKTWAITCPEPQNAGLYSHSEGFCDQGDATMFTGLSCLAATLAGDSETTAARCSDTARAQASDGKWNRGAIWVDKDYPDGDFSRDQSRGVFAYLTAVGYIQKGPEATERAERWLKWISSHDSKICPENQGKCEIGSGVKNLMFNTFRHVGALPSRDDCTQSEYDCTLIRSIYGSQWYLNYGFNLEIALGLWVETDLRDKWYPAHIKASSALIYRVLNTLPDGAVRNRKLARKLGKAVRVIQRKDPDNLLYDFLRNGNRPSLVEKVLDRCSGEKNSGNVNLLHDWAWQRHSRERAWERSDGHDCIFLINLMLAKDYGKLEW